MTTDDGNVLDRLTDGARGVLDGSWIGASTLPSRTLYPHQWSWDSAFMAIGRSWYDEPKAQQELRSLFRAQWADGRVPHIVFNPSVAEDAYFPGPAFWESSKRSPQAPRDVETSGITQPPIHARAALEMHRHARDVEASKAFLAWIYPRLVAEHAYLDGPRTRPGSALPVIMHPWESGLDNSPAWDRDLAEMVIPPGAIPPYSAPRPRPRRTRPTARPTRPTTGSSSSPRATARAATTTRGCSRTVPFLVAGPLFNAIHLWSTHALVEIAEIVGADPTPAPRGRRSGSTTALLARALGSGDAAASARSTSSAASAASRTRSSRSRRSSTPTCPPPSSRRSWPTSAPPASTRTGRTAIVVPTYDLTAEGFDERRYWRGPGLDQHELAALERAAPARPGTTRPTRSCSAACGLVDAVGLPRVLRPVRRRRASAPTGSAGPRR